MILLSSLGIQIPFYFIADAYYVCRTMIRDVTENGNHLITRVKINSVTYQSANPNDGKVGRPQKYSLRFKIKVSFKQVLHTIGTYSYHFWMKKMTKPKRKKGNQHLHHEDKSYRNEVIRKMNAYHRYIQVSLIAQGLMPNLSCKHPKLIWQSFGAWIQTIRPGILPSEMVTSICLRNLFPEFLAAKNITYKATKFIQKRIDLKRVEGLRLVA